MSIMHAEPEMLAATAGELQSINAIARAGNAAVAGPTTGVVPAARPHLSDKLSAGPQMRKHSPTFLKRCLGLAESSPMNRLGSPTLARRSV